MSDRKLLETILQEIRLVKDDVSTLKGDVSTLKEDVFTLKEDVFTLKEDVFTLKEDVSALKVDVRSIKRQQEEDHLILKALEHKADINKAEHGKMTGEIEQTREHLRNMDENINVIKEITGRHEIDITVLKRRPV
ncbi:MAG: hypothetical protein GX962_03885 [Epulopiscium sp.]|nr:hypothetical protein [Candidatus Epulonipiscium sp.]